MEANGSESDDEERGDDNLYDEVPEGEEDDEPPYERMHGEQLYDEVPGELADEEEEEEEYE